MHAARKVVGVGSVGTRAYIMLLLGRDDNDPLFLQFKEAEASVLERFLGKSEYANHGQRVVEGQRLTQAASDIMLGWSRVEGIDGVKRDFYIRQLWDEKGCALVELMEPDDLTFYAKVCGPSSPAPTPAPETPSRSRATSAPATPSTEPSPTSPSSTQTRTNSTTPPSQPPSRPDASKHKQGYNAPRLDKPRRLHRL